MRSWLMIAVVIGRMTLGGGVAVAEVPPVPKERLERDATLIVVGRVTAVESKVVREGKDGSRTDEIRLTVEVSKAEKGQPAKTTVVAVGESRRLGPRETGSSGHRSANGGKGIDAVQAGWQLRLYLRPAGNGDAHPILFPTGFEVVDEGK